VKVSETMASEAMCEATDLLCVLCDRIAIFPQEHIHRGRHTPSLVEICRHCAELPRYCDCRECREPIENGCD